MFELTNGCIVRVSAIVWLGKGENLYTGADMYFLKLLGSPDNTIGLSYEDYLGLKELLAKDIL